MSGWATSQISIPNWTATPCQSQSRIGTQLKGVLIYPEYAHGMPVFSKRTRLDRVWEFVKTYRVSASHRRMVEVRHMPRLSKRSPLWWQKLLKKQCCSFLLSPPKLNDLGEVTDPATAQALRSLLDALAGAIQGKRVSNAIDKDSETSLCWDKQAATIVSM